MKQQVSIRIRMIAPPKGVGIGVQRGRDELLPPVDAAADDLTFEFPIEVDVSTGVPNFLGKYAQGPKDARFIYVNSGCYGGAPHPIWNRRAKLSLMSITAEQVEMAARTPSACLETSFAGTGRDGGPTCASVKGLVWKVVNQ
jgi:hypothetical protein